MPKIGVRNSWWTRFLFRRSPLPTHAAGLLSARPRWRGSVDATRCPVHPGYITPPTACGNPGLTLLPHTSQKCVFGSSNKHQSHSPGETFTVATVCLPTNTNSSNNTAASLPPFLPQHPHPPRISLRPIPPYHKGTCLLGRSCDGPAITAVLTPPATPALFCHCSPRRCAAHPATMSLHTHIQNAHDRCRRCPHLQHSIPALFYHYLLRRCACHRVTTLLQAQHQNAHDRCRRCLHLRHSIPVPSDHSLPKRCACYRVTMPPPPHKLNVQHRSRLNFP